MPLALSGVATPVAVTTAAAAHVFQFAAALAWGAISALVLVGARRRGESEQVEAAEQKFQGRKPAGLRIVAREARNGRACAAALFAKSLPAFSRVYYVSDAANWVIDWEGRYVTRALRTQFGVPAKVAGRAEHVRRQLLHFGSQFAFVKWGPEWAHPSNRVVATFYHGSRTDGEPKMARFVDEFVAAASRLDRIVTPSGLTERKLLDWGIAREKLVRIPLGVDLDLFRPAPPHRRSALRRKFGIPVDAFCIGSFQKDGVGWGEGLEPKLVKGPDIFLRVIERLRQHANVFVLLSGPARGFIKNGLERLNVPYRHEFLRHYPDIVRFYQCLDLYLVTSRDEGGPKAIVESAAAGVPVVSTQVGMAPDVIRDGLNGFVCRVGDVESLAARAIRLMEDEALRLNIVAESLRTAREYAWPVVGRQYFHKLYAPLLRQGILK